MLVGNPYARRSVPGIQVSNCCFTRVICSNLKIFFLRNYDEFVHGVAELGVRPQIPKDTPSKLRKLMQACWHQDPYKRPSFGEVAEVQDLVFAKCGLIFLSQKMLGVIIQCAIEDKMGRKFWAHSFPSQYHITWYSKTISLMCLLI